MASGFPPHSRGRDYTKIRVITAHLRILPNTIAKNAGHPVIFEFYINNKYFL